MELQLDSVEARVLGALIEKEISTPDYYPLTLNSLTTACNQKNNRDPVADFDEKAVVRALDNLRLKQLARMVSGADQRVPKYYHRAGETLGLERPALALVCELLLRGPQTVGELRGRCSRLWEFPSLEEVEAGLQTLMDRQAGALVTRLPRQPGRKESRYAHLLCGEPQLPAEEHPPRLESATLEVRAENERLAALEAEVQRLSRELEALRGEFAQFRKQFE
ncbi:MAG: YceH family protein [Candidatus Latescibacteria bacterium]|nr:YceH family protein [Candidatus Latescibacterota bacterium]